MSEPTRGPRTRGPRTRGLLAGTASVVLALALAACGGGSSSGAGAGSSGSNGSGEATPSFSTGTTMARLSQAKKITVGTKFDQPGFGLQGLDGKPKGFDVEIATLIAAKLGIPASGITFIETPSAIREEVLEQGRADVVVATYTINDKRKKRITFAGPYYTAGQDIMVGKDDSAITGPESLKANPTSKVCSVTGSTPSENIKKYLAAPGQLVLFDVYSKCADALRTGQVKAVTTDNVILLGLASKASGAFKLVGKPFTQEPYGIGIKKADVAFCEFINGVLKDAASSGAYQKAWTSTAGSVEGTQTPTLPTAASCS